MNSQDMANLLLPLILEKRHFQRFWIEETAEILNFERTMKNQHNLVKPPVNDSKKALVRKEAQLALDLMSEDCESAIKFYQRNLNLAEKKCASTNYDPNTSALFELSLQFDRLIGSKQLNLERWNFLGNRLRRLIGNFSRTVSNSYCIATVQSYAITLCELMYKYEEYITLYDSEADTRILTTSIDRFYKIVILNLNETNKNKKKTPCTRVFRSPGFKLCFAKTPTRPRGFLLPPNLEASRNQIWRSITENKT
ncbi:unnamed protein product [Bursaphelenchus xylophilus]|uniref:(pine wood nematode) hypothetical protein n=1 Tax=Bursaphelenchus xylophilus TaxID=6326 RepID=A0A1I7RY37_BURXY|nr:unnamed protein product [Bursaphelenchus xylophilus]CAG9085247.1 unnamed protein product [Bursaphelenchus xylophilus]